MTGSGNGNENGKPGEDDGLGAQWLSPTPESADDELGAFLRNSIPAPRADYWETIEDRIGSEPDSGVADSETSDDVTDFLHASIPAPGDGYWESIDSRLATIERDQGHTDGADTGTAVIRPMSMQNQSRRSNTNPLMFAAAAVLIVVASLGLVAALNRGSDDGIDLATQQPETSTSVPGTPTDPGDNETATATDAGTPGTTQITGPGALTTMQTRLTTPADTDALFCFAAPNTRIVPIEDPVTGLAVVQFSVQGNGSYSFLALQNDMFLTFTAGEGSADGQFDTAPLGIVGLSRVLPPYLVTLTDASISLGSESTLPAVNCAEVDDQVQIMRTEIAKVTDEAGGVIPIETLGPLVTMRAALDGVVSEGSQAFCFRGEDVRIVARDNRPAGPAVLQLQIQPTGLLTFVAMQNDGFVLSGTAVGSAEGEVYAHVIGHGDSSSNQPLAQLFVTNDTLMIGQDTLNIVDCLDIAESIERAESLLDTHSSTPAFAIDADQTLSSAGLGPIRIGMLVSELEAALGTELEIDTLGDPTPGACGRISSTIDPRIDVMVETTADNDAIVRRIDTSSDRWATPSGIRTGMTEQQLIDAFPGQLDIRPHAYSEGSYLTFIPSDVNAVSTVEFVVQYGLVVNIQSGAYPWVSLIEGCA